MRSAFSVATVLVGSHALKINTLSQGELPEQKKVLTRVTDAYEMGTLGYFPERTEGETPNDLLSKESYPCLFKLGNAFYDFTPFKIAQNVWPAYWANLTDMTVDPTNPNWRPSSDYSYQYEFGFCQQMTEANNATCALPVYAIGSDINGTAFYENPDPAAFPPTQCQPYSGSSSSNIEASEISKDVVNAADNTVETVTGVAITYTGGECATTGGPATFTIKAWCNPNITVADTEYNGEATCDLTTDPDCCNPYVEITSSIGGCDLFSNSMIWEYLAYAEPYLGIIGIVGGLCLTFYGLKLIKPAICFAGFLTCTMLALLFFYAVYATSVDELATFYYWMAGGAVVGIIVGYFLSAMVKVGAAILAGWGGFMLGLILNEAFLYQFEAVWVFWAANVGAALICAGLTFKYFEPMFIFATVIIGSYGLIRGASCYFGHYYNEFVIVNLLKSGAVD